MSRDKGPPEKERPNGYQAARPIQKSADTTTDKPKPTTQPRQCHCETLRRPADLFREGFRRGFADALRLAAREFDDPAAWLVLSRLADRYDLAGGDQ
jgi:hypothetical protein